MGVGSFAELVFLGSDHSPVDGFVALARLWPAAWAATAGLPCFPDSYFVACIYSAGVLPFHIASTWEVSSHSYSSSFVVN